MLKNIIIKIRLKYVAISHFSSYSQSIMDQMVHTLLGHNKIIHFRNGFPVISLISPALFSEPSAHYFSKIFHGVLQNKMFPNLLSFAINMTCNANCKHCSFFSEKNNLIKHELSLDECKNVIKQSQQLGVSVISFVGGEPLMREDFTDIIASVDKKLSTTVMFTNGWFLTQKAESLKKAGLDSIYISIDSAKEEKHDEIRGKKGLFKRAMEGATVAKKLGFSLGFSCCIGKEEFNNGELAKIVELGREMGVHEILIFDKIPTGRMGGCESLVDDFWTDNLSSAVEKYNLDASYPGVVPYARITSYQGYGCTGGTRYLYVSPSGDITPCDFNHATFGNILSEPLYKIWDRMSSQPEFKSATWGGCKMKDSHYRENGKITSTKFAK